MAARDKLNKFMAKLDENDADVQQHLGSCYSCIWHIGEGIDGSRVLVYVEWAL